MRAIFVTVIGGIFVLVSSVIYAEELSVRAKGLIGTSLLRKDIQEALSLSSQQQEQIKSSMQSFNEKQRSIKDEYNKKMTPLQEEMRGKIDKLRGEQSQEVSKILTKDQLQKLEDIAQNPAKYRPTRSELLKRPKSPTTSTKPRKSNTP